MSRRLEAMRANPNGDWRIADVEALCQEHGVLCAPPRGGGSHYKVAHPAVVDKIAMPFRRPIKPIYIKRLVALIDTVRSVS